MILENKRKMIELANLIEDDALGLTLQKAALNKKNVQLVIVSKIESVVTDQFEYIDEFDVISEFLNKEIEGLELNIDVYKNMNSLLMINFPTSLLDVVISEIKDAIDVKNEVDLNKREFEKLESERIEDLLQGKIDGGDLILLSESLIKED